MGYDTTSNYQGDIPAKADEIIRLAREKKKKEAEGYAEFQAQKMREKYPEHAEYYSRQNYYGYSQSDWDEYRTSVDGMYGEIKEAYIRFGTPDPKKFTPLIDSVKAAEDRLAAGEAQSSANTAESTMAANWSGAFSSNLRNGFLSPIVSAIPANQQILARAVRESLEANKALYEVAQNNIFVLSQKTIDALEKCGEKDADDLKAGLVILGCVTAIVGAALSPFTGGSSLVLGISMSLSIIGAAAGTTNFFIPPAEDKPLGGKTVDDVLANMYGVMSDAWTDISTKEDDIIKACDDNYEKVVNVRQQANSAGKASPLTPLRPTIADAKDPAEGLRAN